MRTTYVQSNTSRERNWNFIKICLQALIRPCFFFVFFFAYHSNKIVNKSSKAAMDDMKKIVQAFSMGVFLANIAMAVRYVLR